MELALRHDDHSGRSFSAAFVPGSGPGDWLREISSWQIDPAGLSCVILSESLQSVRPAGLFVLFPKNKMPDAGQVRLPYQQIAGKLFIPVQSVLYPQVNTEELSKLLLWDLYVFHPALGLVGFEMADRVDLVQLLAIDPPLEKRWDRAHPGNDSPPPFNRIGVEGTSPEELLDNLKEEIEKKPIEDLKKDKPQTAGSKLLNALGRGSLKAGLAVTGGVAGMLGGLGGLLGGGGFGSAGVSGGAGGGAGGTGGSGGEGLFSRFEKWMKQKLDDLEKQREEELARLLRMFEEDPELALQYALPLNSPYFKRGDATPTGKLSRRDTNFSLGKLGGGGRVDAWNVGNYYNSLHTQYTRNAERELKAGNHKRAAYIYAHLLGNFSMAANVLQQGKYYREAAALYDKHLNNKVMAAECLEKGGLYLEAIGYFAALGMDERVGDLYQKMERREEAHAHYTKCVTKAIANDDYLEAARITGKKMEEPGRARQYLLDGWRNSSRQEACLNAYFDEAAAAGYDPVKELQSVYALHTPPAMENHFLNVLTQQVRKPQSGELEKTSRNLAYKIIGKQLEQENQSNVAALRFFLPQDKLIAADCSRFVITSKKFQPKPILPKRKKHQLDKTVRWISARNFRGDIVALGVKDNSQLILTRVNTTGEEETLSWGFQADARDHFFLLCDPRVSERIVVICNRPLELTPKKFGSGPKFSGVITVNFAPWLPVGLLAAGHSFNNSLVMVSAPYGTYMLSRYNVADGRLQHTTECKYGDGLLTRNSNRQGACSELLSRDNRFYFVDESSFFALSSTGESFSVSFGPEEVRLLSMPEYARSFVAALATTSGFLILKGATVETARPSEIFALDFNPAILQFISEDYLVIASYQRVMVIDVRDTPVQKMLIETDSQVVAIVSSPRKNYFAVLEASGLVQFYDAV